MYLVEVLQERETLYFCLSRGYTILVRVQNSRLYQNNQIRNYIQHSNVGHTVHQNNKQLPCRIILHAVAVGNTGVHDRSDTSLPF